mgnify:CR=1 FL=1
MSVYYKIYIKSGCPYCTKALEVLDKHRQEYVVNVMDGNDDLLTEVKSTWNWQTIPIIIEVSDRNGFKFVGGYTDLCKHLGEEID